jgi:hypothetical protein
MKVSQLKKALERLDGGINGIGDVDVVMRVIHNYDCEGNELAEIKTVSFVMSDNYSRIELSESESYNIR